MKDISELVPVGYRNAIPREELMRRTGVGDRQMRELIKASPVLICNLQDDKGYFRPAEDEEHLVKMFRRQENKRSLSTGRTVRKCDDWIRDRRAEKSDLVKNQISLFEWLGGADGKHAERQR
ncbi:hypothetical protein LQE92_08940 [Lacrimispora sp. NSJ-141]|uniref:Uncharacterized protein n=1 Tax=Lientehia hominis TaxID=2897778 RepID=A0AAP2RJV1_9FIRM|nr:hypothetical protein [Lientehia hominis]MCD2492753.1 hypothetical protein [Lientehia hominis]